MVYSKHNFPESVGGSLPIVKLAKSGLHCISLHEKLDLYPIYPEYKYDAKNFKLQGNGKYRICPRIQNPCNLGCKVTRYLPPSRPDSSL